MPIDRSLIAHALDILIDLQGGSLPADTLATEIEWRAHRRIDVSELNRELTRLLAAGAVAKRHDGVLDRDLWSITEVGRNVRREMA